MKCHFDPVKGQGMKKAIMSILTVWMLVISVFVGLIGLGDIGNVKAPFTIHDPIRINSNSEFTSMAGLEGWNGDGSAGKPYIIEGYDINGSGHGYCIYVGNTTVHFVVRNSYLHEASGFGSWPYYPDSGIILNNVKNGIVANNNASFNNWHGIELFLSRNIAIANNTASSNNEYGIHHWESNNNTIINNTASNNGIGIMITASNSNTIANNTASNNGIGIQLIYTNKITITNNTISSNKNYGIYLSDSISNTFTYNEMVDDGFFIFGDMLEHWNTHIIDTTNTVNGKPVYYWKNQTDNTIPLGAGQVILANCKNVKIENQNLNYSTVGIQLGFSSNNTIASNNASNNMYGIYHWESNNNTITYNTASSNNWYGIGLHLSENNTITYNNASLNNHNGIELGFSLYNIITYNTISLNNNYGIYLQYARSNSIYHNNIIENTKQAYDNTDNGNQWDNGYPIGGNWWSDFDEEGEGAHDDFQGKDQDLAGGDGIVDNGTTGGGGKNPYIIDSNSRDNYPLIRPFGSYLFLYEGWNLISIPFVQIDTSLKSVLETINSSFDAVQWYDARNGFDAWKHYQISKPPNLNDLKDINHSMGFWIHITKPSGVLFKYPGTQPSSNHTIPLYPGWNVVGYPSLTNYNRTESLNNLTFGDQVDAILSYDAAFQKWEEMGVSDYFELSKGYYIHATSECEWEVPL